MANPQHLFCNTLSTSTSKPKFYHHSHALQKSLNAKMPTTGTERAVTSQVESLALQTNITASLGQAANTHGQATLKLPAGPISVAGQVLNVPNTHFEEDYDPLYAHSLGPNFNVLEGATSKIHFEVLFRAGIIRKGDVLTMKIDFLRNERWENGEARLLVCDYRLFHPQSLRE